MKLLFKIIIINSLLITLSCNTASDSNAKEGGIISLLPSLTEIVCNLGLEDSLVGRSSFCNYPKNIIETVPSMGGCIKPNIEKIVKLRPSLILLGDMQKDLARKFKSFNIKTEIFNQESINDIYNTINKIGQLTNRKTQADSIVNYIKISLDSIKQVSPKIKKPVLFVVGRNPGTLSGITTVNKTGFLAELLEISGGKTIFPDLKLVWAKVSVEEIIKRNPYYIIEPSGMGNPKDALKTWSKLKTLKATKDNNIYVVNGEHFFIPSPRIVKTAKELSYILAK